MKSTVEEILRHKGHEVWTIAPEATVLEALKIMADKDIGALVVVKDGQVVGIISERDYARKVVLRGRASVNTRVKEIMTNKVYYVTPQTTVQQCQAMFTEYNIRHLPVLENEQLVGLVSIGDIVKAIIEGQEDTITHLSDYITGKYI